MPTNLTRAVVKRNIKMRRQPAVCHVLSDNQWINIWKRRIDKHVNYMRPAFHTWCIMPHFYRQNGTVSKFILKRLISVISNENSGCCCWIILSAGLTGFGPFEKLHLSFFFWIFTWTVWTALSPYGAELYTFKFTEIERFLFSPSFFWIQNKPADDPRQLRSGPFSSICN